MDLSRVDLVTASACETQNGEFVEGEGTENFSQAFLSSGARSVISSLWRVDDKATASLMKNFYGALSSGTPASEALRQAKLKDTRHPFYWAAFVLSGDPDVRLPLVITWTMALAGALALVGLILVAVHFLRTSGRKA